MIARNLAASLDDVSTSPSGFYLTVLSNLEAIIQTCRDPKDTGVLGFGKVARRAVSEKDWARKSEFDAITWKSKHVDPAQPEH